MNEFLQRLRSYFVSLPPQRRATLLGTVLLTLAGTAALWGWAVHEPMVPLFDAPLDARAASDVMQALDRQQIRYEIEPRSQRILVPADRRDQVNLELSGTLGLADRSRIGLEIFDDGGFGTTRFVEHVRYVRGLQGELERQLAGFGKVRGAKVLLSVPEDSLFAEDREDPSASVYLELRAGDTLSHEEGRRMADLVAHAVPRLRREHVEILDSKMKTIHAATGDENASTSKLTELQHRYERYYQRKVESLLERVVGHGKVSARISVALDTAERRTIERKLDPDNATLISNRLRESSQLGGISVATGVPGTTANLPENQASSGAGGVRQSKTTESDELGNYDVPEQHLTSASRPGTVLKVTAAVLVDGRYEGALKGTKGEAAGPTFITRPLEELDRFAVMTAQALGTTKDNVSVFCEPFAPLEIAQAPKPSVLTGGVPPMAEALARYGLALLALVLTFTMVVRPLTRQLGAAPPGPGDNELTEGDHLGELEGSESAGLLNGAVEPQAGHRGRLTQATFYEWLAAASSGDVLLTREEVGRLVTTDLDHSASTLREWINQPELDEEDDA